MVTLILGKKGSGKTKRLIDMCNAAMAASKGNVVFIEKDSTLTYDLSHKARLAVADSYDIQGFDSFYGFIAGMCAGNYDITDVFVDSTLKLVLLAVFLVLILTPVVKSILRKMKAGKAQA